MLALTASCGPDRKTIAFLPPPPADAFRREARPAFPPGAAESEALYEIWVSNIDDHGKRADITIWRGCRYVNDFLEKPIDCGPAPEGSQP